MKFQILRKDNKNKSFEFWDCWPFIKCVHDDDIKWKYFPRNWPFVRGIHRGPVNSPHKGQWRGALMFSLTCISINGWVNNREAGDLRRYRGHYDVNVMRWTITKPANSTMRLSHFLECTTLEHKCTHLCSNVVYCEIWYRCILEFAHFCFNVLYCGI